MFRVTRAELHATEGTELGRCSGATAPLSARNYNSPDVSIAIVPTYQSSFLIVRSCKTAQMYADPQTKSLLSPGLSIGTVASDFETSESRDVLNRSARAKHLTRTRVHELLPGLRLELFTFESRKPSLITVNVTLIQTLSRGFMRHNAELNGASLRRSLEWRVIRIHSLSPLLSVFASFWPCFSPVLVSIA